MLWAIALHSSTHPNSRKCGNTFVDYKPNPVRVFKTQNGYAILCFGIKYELKAQTSFNGLIRSILQSAETGLSF